MNSLPLKKLAATTISLLFLTWASAQTRYDGDRLTALLGTSTQSQEFAGLATNYQLEMANETHYLSTQGIELILASGAIKEMQLYRNSAVYGQFTGALPIGLSFGMSAAQVRAILGKPTVAYNSSGYLEFEQGKYVYACSFEKGQLNQLSVSMK